MFDVVGIISNAAIKALVTFSLVAFPFLFSPACWPSASCHLVFRHNIRGPDAKLFFSRGGWYSREINRCRSITSLAEINKGATRSVPPSQHVWPFLSSFINNSAENPQGLSKYRPAKIRTRGLQAEPKFVMSSDEAYSAFLERANQDTGTKKEDSSSTAAINTKSVDTDVPPQLQNIKQYYTSEVDEPFEPVSLSWDGPELPSEGKNTQPFLRRYGLQLFSLGPG